MGKPKKKSGRVTGRRWLYVARVVVDEELAPGLVVLNVYHDRDVIQLADGDRFVTILTEVPLFGEGRG